MPRRSRPTEPDERAKDQQPTVGDLYKISHPTGVSHVHLFQPPGPHLDGVVKFMLDKFYVFFWSPILNARLMLLIENCTPRLHKTVLAAKPEKGPSGPKGLSGLGGVAKTLRAVAQYLSSICAASAEHSRTNDTVPNGCRGAQRHGGHRKRFRQALQLRECTGGRKIISCSCRIMLDSKGVRIRAPWPSVHDPVSRRLK